MLKEAPKCENNKIRDGRMMDGNDKYLLPQCSSSTSPDEYFPCKLKICNANQINDTNCANSANRICNISKNEKCGIRSCKITELDDTCQNPDNKICKKKCYNNFNDWEHSLDSITTPWGIKPSILDLGKPSSIIKCYNNFCKSNGGGSYPILISNDEITTLKACSKEDYWNLKSRCFTIAKCDNKDFKLNKNTQYEKVCKKPIDFKKIPLTKDEYKKQNPKFCKNIF